MSWSESCTYPPLVRCWATSPVLIQRCQDCPPFFSTGSSPPARHFTTWSKESAEKRYKHALNLSKLVIFWFVCLRLSYTKMCCGAIEVILASVYDFLESGYHLVVFDILSCNSRLNIKRSCVPKYKSFLNVLYKKLFLKLDFTLIKTLCM